MVAHQQFGFRTGLHNHQDTAIRHRVHITTENIHQLNWTLHNDTFRHIDHKTILSQHRVQSNDTILTGRSRFTVITGGYFGIFLHESTHPPGINAFGKMGFRQHLVIESIIHHKIKRSTQVGDVTTEYVIRIDRDIETIDIHPIVRSKSLGHIGIFIIFTLHRRKAQPLQISQSLCAGCILHA
ncbi:unknown [Parabacteroides johnsonii CAG:246]|nr:unknown [Parabacteroides johnsonii CAG:246]